MAYDEKRKQILGRTRFQKFIFLAQEIDNKFGRWYTFIPYKHGPFSPALQRDIDELIENNLIKEVPERFENEKIRYRYSLTSKGRKLVEGLLSSRDFPFDQKYLLKVMSKIKKDYRYTSLDELINEIYGNYPQFAIYAE